MNKTEKYKLWDEFLAKWPLDRLSRMTLREYHTVGDEQCFVRWIESHLSDMGSIWGGSAFKFGIFHRKAEELKAGGAGRSYTEEYAWYSKYGTDADEAFQNVRNLIVGVANAARAGDLEKIDQVDLGTAVKWKIAFHYQERELPVIAHVFSDAHLREFLGESAKGLKSHSELYRKLDQHRGGEDVLDFSERVWIEADERIKDRLLSSEDAESFLRTRFSAHNSRAGTELF